MTEFGRRVHENASLGTDHGRGSVMLALGGACADLSGFGGRVVGDWPGLESGVLEGPGDLPVVHDYRDVLTPLLRWHADEAATRGSAQSMPQVFPGHRPGPLL